MSRDKLAVLPCQVSMVITEVSIIVVSSINCRVLALLLAIIVVVIIVMLEFAAEIIRFRAAVLLSTYS